ncbi:hypothetical protein [Methanoculleus sp.]|jgi:hypothetical protein|uniref:hypothetical protein n=1 Tax=Methanoculleus sp. TaxID=90427 RepID=UPI001BD409D7|nr:hypothetical protein [Methanoculleus sp.]
MPKRKKTASATPLLDSLSAEQAHAVLARLIRDDPALTARAEGVARDLLRIVDSEKIADSLAGDLAEIEDVWETSGRTHDGGYLYPSERAWKMMDEVVASYKEEMTAYLRRGMADESRLFCTGILLGIRRFERDSGSALLDEVPDYCDDAFSSVREEWEAAVGDPGQVRLLARFLEEKGLL